MPNIQASTHFLAGTGGIQFWQWQDDGEVVTWYDGTTIAFTAELKKLQDAFTGRYSPPFGAVLFVLAACREDCEIGLARQRFLAEALTSIGGKKYLGVLDRVTTGLDIIRALPKEHRESLAAKQDLLLALFEDAAFKDAQGFMRPDIDLVDASDDFPQMLDPAAAHRQLCRDLHALDIAFEWFDVSRLPLRKQTGLDALPAKADVDLPPGVAVRRLLDAIEVDEELGGMARIARQIMAAAQLPRRLDDSDELPMGGVCDISPRGPLDRLLLSELAQDDLVLSVRIALNEAMYLRREAPPRSPPRRRWLLIDAGVRTWGVPRVFATGVALAFSATDEHGVDVSAFRSVDGKAEGADLRSQRGLTAQLAALDSSAHCGESLEWLIAKANAEREPVEIVVVTEASAAADPDFHRIVEKLPLDEFYLATVRRDGRFELSRRNRRGAVRLSQATLDLDELLKPRRNSRRLFDTAKSGEWPAFYHARPHPLRIGASIDPQHAWYVHDLGVLSITQGKRLLHWDRPDRGARLIDVELPSRWPQWCLPCTGDFDVTWAVIGTPSSGNYWSLRLNVDDWTAVSTRLERHMTAVKCVTAFGSTAFLIGKNRVEALSMETGKLLFAGILRIIHVAGRFFTGPVGAGGPFVIADDDGDVVYPEVVDPREQSSLRDWFAMSFDGTNVRFDHVYRETADRPQLLTMFDVVNIEGPVGLTDAGNFYFTGSGKTVNRQVTTSGYMSVQAVAHDGLRVSTVTAGVHAYQAHQIYETLTGESVPAGDPAVALHGAQFAEIVHSSRQNVPRRRFSGIAIRANGQLALVGRRRNLWPIDAEGRMELAKHPIPMQGETVFEFGDEVECQKAEGGKMQMASWANGGRAWLDPGGMLHLKSGDRTLAEISIVLRDGQTSGWCSDGRRWGWPYYIGEATQTDTGIISREVFRPLVATLA